ncbi:MAG: hypothetical protein ACHQVS_00505 [Candidatus Babeliales bacterium]
MFRYALLLLLVSTLGYGAERGGTPPKIERPKPIKEAPRDTKEKHRLAKKNIHIYMDRIEGRKLVFTNDN